MVGPARLAENPAGNPVLYLALLKMCVFFLFLKSPEMGNLLGIGSISVAPLLQIQDHHSRFKRLKRALRLGSGIPQKGTILRVIRELVGSFKHLCVFNHGWDDWLR